MNISVVYERACAGVCAEVYRRVCAGVNAGGCAEVNTEDLQRLMQ